MNISTLNPVERLALRDILIVNGFEFEKRKCRQPGTKEIVEHSAGIRLLDKKNFGRTVIGVDLDLEKNQWFVAPNWESSQLNPEKIYEIKDGKMKLAAAALVSKIETEFESPVGGQQEETKLVENPPDDASVPTITPSQSPGWVPETEPVPGKTKERPAPRDQGTGYEQVIKNVSQAKVNLTKNTKGYNWVVSAYADNLNDAIDQAIAADQRLRLQFGTLGV